MDDAPVHAGDLLAGKYRVERVLGSGGMGVVVAAQHVELGQRVALKFLLQGALHNPEAASRFLREARAAVQIESEHVARVLDVGRLEDGAPYLVMEYLEGTDLANLARGEALPIETAVDYVLQACEAMAVAHSLGIVHRDLKPANLFLTRRPDGSPLLKVLDFGISKMNLMESSLVLTQATAFMGSPLYMSPEQARNASTVDARTDIWSLGVILYELLTGAPPFLGETLTEVISLLITATPKPIRALRPSVPAELERAVLRALEKPLDRRYAHIGELSAALVEFGLPHSRMLHQRVSGVLSRAGVSVREPAPGDGAPLLSAPREAQSSPEELAPGRLPRVAETNSSWVQRTKPALSRTRVSLLVTGGVLATCAGAWFWLQRPRATAESATREAPSAVHGSDRAPVPPVESAPEPAAVPSAALSANAAPAREPAVDPSKASGPAVEAPGTSRKVKARAPKPVNTARGPDASPQEAPPRPKKNPLAIDFK